MSASLNKYRNQPDWKRFFEILNRLDELTSEIKDLMHDAADTSAQDVEAARLLQELDSIKDDLAKKTSSKDEYDDIYAVVSSWKEDFL